MSYLFKTGQKYWDTLLGGLHKVRFIFASEINALYNNFMHLLIFLLHVVTCRSTTQSYTVYSYASEHYFVCALSFLLHHIQVVF